MQILRNNIKAIAMIIVISVAVLPAAAMTALSYWLWTIDDLDYSYWLLASAVILTVFRLSCTIICSSSNKKLLQTSIELPVSYLIMILSIAYLAIGFLNVTLTTVTIFTAVVMILGSAYIAKCARKVYKKYKTAHRQLYDLLVDANAHWHYFKAGSIEPVSYTTWQQAKFDHRLKGIIFKNRHDKLLSILITDIDNNRKSFEKELYVLCTSFISDDFTEIQSLQEDEQMYSLPDSIIHFENC